VSRCKKTSSEKRKLTATHVEHSYAITISGTPDTIVWILRMILRRSNLLVMKTFEKENSQKSYI